MKIVPFALAACCFGMVACQSSTARVDTVPANVAASISQHFPQAKVLSGADVKGDQVISTVFIDDISFKVACDQQTGQLTGIAFNEADEAEAERIRTQGQVFDPAVLADKNAPMEADGDHPAHDRTLLDEAGLIPEVAQALRAQFPTAKVVEAEDEDDLYEVNLEIGTIAFEVIYNEVGELVAMESEDGV